MFSQRIRKRYYKTFGTSVINNPLFPPPPSLSLWVVWKTKLCLSYACFASRHSPYTNGLSRATDRVAEKKNIFMSLVISRDSIGCASLSSLFIWSFQFSFFYYNLSILVLFLVMNWQQIKYPITYHLSSVAILFYN